MTRHIGIDLSCSPAHGVVLETTLDGSLTGVHCTSSIPLMLAENTDDEFARSVLAAEGFGAVLAPPISIALTLGLPFADKRRVNALLPQELEDTLPFPCAEFAYGLSWSGSSKTSSGKGSGHLTTRHDFHLQLAPRTAIREAIEQLANLGIDPTLVTPHSALLSPIADAILRMQAKIPQEAETPGAQSESFFLVTVRHPNASPANNASTEAGTPRAEKPDGVNMNAIEVEVLFLIERRVVHHQKLSALKTESGFSWSAALLLELGAVVRRFGKEVLHGFVVTMPSDAGSADTSTILARTAQTIAQELAALSLRIETIALEDLFPDLKISASNVGAILAALCSVQLSKIEDSSPDSPLSATDAAAVAAAMLASTGGHPAVLGGVLTPPINFRRGEFSYRPPQDELLRAGKKLLWPLLWGLGSIIACYAVLYVVRAQEIAHLEKRIAEAVYSAAPLLVAAPGQELTALNDEAAKMEQELKDIGTSDSGAPLELYAELTRHFPTLPDTTVDRVLARGNSIEVRGCAPSYRVIEQIENALTKVKAFAKVKKGSAQSCSGGNSGARGFTFEVSSRG